MTDTENVTRLPRMRTLDECYTELKAMDEHTSISKYNLRQLLLSGVLPTVMCGRKRLVNLDLLYEYLADPTAEKFEKRRQQAENNRLAAAHGIRKIGWG